MGKTKRGRSGQKHKNSTPPTPTAEGGNIKGEPNAQAKANDCRYVKQESPNIYVNIPEAKQEKWSYANKIAAGMGIVTLALTIFTYLLFVKAGVQADQAVRAANSADSVFSETQKEFEIENEPYLQVMQPRIVTFIVGQPMRFNYFFVNLGKYPAKILTLDVGGKANSYPPNVEDSNTFKIANTLPDFINTFIIKESALIVDSPGTDNRPLTASKYFELINHVFNYYFYGRIQYQNLANKKRRIYSFVVQLDPITKAAHYIYNENKEVTLGE
jgi:hypothetical protein